MELEYKLDKRIKFRPLSLEDKAKYEELFFNATERGCELSFANLFLWGEREIAFFNGDAIVFSRYGSHTSYSYPLGKGDKRPIIDAIINDASIRGVPAVIGGLTSDAKNELESLFPEKFEYASNRGMFDYVYKIEDLSELKGKNYQKKRNHLRRFTATYPSFSVIPISEELLPSVREMALSWYDERESKLPNSDFQTERLALERALANYKELSFEGLLLVSNNEVLAFTIGSQMSKDTFDVHFEKALLKAEGAYAVINNEFARYIRANHPEIRFLNREEDMGLEGLRKAKLSYFPDHLVEKHRAKLKEEI